MKLRTRPHPLQIDGGKPTLMTRFSALFSPKPPAPAVFPGSPMSLCEQPASPMRFDFDLEKSMGRTSRAVGRQPARGSRRMSRVLPAQAADPELESLRQMLRDMDLDADGTPEAAPPPAPAADPGPAGLDRLLAVCGQSRVLGWRDILSVDAMETAEKIGEATYSEVFQLPLSALTDAPVKRPVPPPAPATPKAGLPALPTKATRGRRGYPGNTAGEPQAVIKVVPFGFPDQLVNGAPQPSCEDVFNEVKISSVLGKGKGGRGVGRLGGGFIRVHAISVVSGRFPAPLVAEWREYELTHGSSNASPAAFAAGQKFLVIVLEHGGADLNNFPLKTWRQAWSVLVQVLEVLAWGEALYGLNHRDVHLGNILIQKTPAAPLPGGLGLDDQAAALLDASGRVSSAFGVKVSVIDYTLSRLQDGREVFFLPLEDEGYFLGVGDIQYDKYREMRDVVVASGGDWSHNHPRHNVLWMHYLVVKLLQYRTLPPLPRTQLDKKFQAALVDFEQRILSYNSIQTIFTGRRDPLLGAFLQT